VDKNIVKDKGQPLLCQVDIEKGHESREMGGAFFMGRRGGLEIKVKIGGTQRCLNNAGRDCIP